MTYDVTLLITTTSSAVFGNEQHAGLMTQSTLFSRVLTIPDWSVLGSRGVKGELTLGAPGRGFETWQEYGEMRENAVES